MKNKETKRIECIYLYIKKQIMLWETEQISTTPATENIKLLLNKLKNLLEEYACKTVYGEFNFVDETLIECYKAAINFENDKIFITEEDENNFLKQVRGTMEALENGKMNISSAYALLFIIYNNNTATIIDNQQTTEKAKTIGPLSLV